MRLVDNRDNTEPHLNLALEEYLVRNANLREDFLLLYINQPAVIVGKHQNVIEEVNLKYCAQNDIPVLRRISGGGTVYHDPGNLNFSFITEYSKQKFNNYRYFVKPIVGAIRKLGASAELDQNNNIVINGKKVSGNAQFTSRDRMISHGTLLFKANLDALKSVLYVCENRVVESKSTKSKRARITNISDHLRPNYTIELFQDAVENELGNIEKLDIFEFTETQWNEIHKLAEEKYFSDKWNLGLSPECKITYFTSANQIGLKSIHIRKGRIAKLTFEDSNKSETQKIREILIGSYYEYNKINKRISVLSDKQNESINELLF